MSAGEVFICDLRNLDPALAAEVGPWLDQWDLEAAAMLAVRSSGSQRPAGSFEGRRHPRRLRVAVAVTNLTDERR